MDEWVLGNYSSPGEARHGAARTRMIEHDDLLPPHICDSRSPTMGNSASGEPPGTEWVMMRTGLSG